MEVKKISIREAKKRIKNDPELSKMLVRSGWREIALDLDGDGMADVSFSSEKVGRKIDTIAVDLSGNGEYNLYLHDFDGNGIPDTVCLVEDGEEEQVVAFGGEVELGFINLGVRVANLLVAEDFMNRELGISLADLAAYLKMHAAAMLVELEKRENAEGIDKVYYFLNDAQTYYLATVDGDKPRVRPFGTALIYDGRLYIQTGKVKLAASDSAVDFAVTEAKSNQMLLSMLVPPNFIQNTCVFSSSALYIAFRDGIFSSMATFTSRLSSSTSSAAMRIQLPFM